MSTRVVDRGSTRRLRRRPGRRAVGLVSAFAACVCVALLTTVVWSVGNQVQQRQIADARAEATWAPGPRWMVDTTSQTDIQSLRARGWAVPGLAAEGYSITNIQQSQAGDQPVVAVTLHNDHGSVTIVEQRGHINPDNPTDGITGLPVGAEGMRRSVLDGARLWVDRSPPWRAVMVRPDAVYTLSSDTAPATLAQTVSAVVAEDRGRVSLPSQKDESFGATLVDGFREIFG